MFKGVRSQGLATYLRTTWVVGLCLLPGVACSDYSGTSAEAQYTAPSAAGLVAAAPFANAPEAQFVFHWRRLKSNFISDDGRVIDIGSEGSISTSEGQAYGMFFALVANDQATFDALLRWTQNNLAPDGFEQQLPAWLWGEHNDPAPGENAWQILDDNPASDADIWMAYSLIEAARLWQEPRYRELGEQLARQVLDNVTIEIKGQLYLLPAPYGFNKPEQITFNPSYFSLTLFAGLDNTLNDPRWGQLYQSSLQLLAINAAHFDGFYSDWMALSPAGKLRHREQMEGSYDAIRTYLWVQLEADRRPQDDRLQVLLEGPKAMLDYIREHGFPPEHIYPDSQLDGTGPIGFSTILLPWLRHLDPAVAASQQVRLLQTPVRDYEQRYFDTMLILYGLGAEQCYFFNDQAQLEVNWDAPHCNG